MYRKDYWWKVLLRSLRRIIYIPAKIRSVFIIITSSLDSDNWPWLCHCPRAKLSITSTAHCAWLSHRSIAAWIKMGKKLHDVHPSDIFEILHLPFVLYFTHAARQGYLIILFFKTSFRLRCNSIVSYWRWICSYSGKFAYPCQVVLH